MGIQHNWKESGLSDRVSRIWDLLRFFTLLFQVVSCHPLPAYCPCKLFLCFPLSIAGAWMALLTGTRSDEELGLGLELELHPWDR
jgi:hypothetical protein